ncbi:hypothetical protein [Chondrinema litorale]|uniref:hypothetical protein n=1 Tax=Chondrinema litorale TaxID=2994555 RepID=UPI002543F8DE|nr:hypothetical protein [Chondrinema litorale]UZR93551.1 hypothetical protein OQ292_17000 [Chondrinema litorale]
MNNITQNSVKPVNFGKIWENSGGRKKFLIDILSSIVDGLRDYPVLINDAVNKKQYDELKNTSHKCKSCINYLFHDELNNLLESLEEDGKQKNINAATTENMERLKVVTGSILPVVQQHLNQLERL